MSEISDLMASNDPMATPVMNLGAPPPPPVNTMPGPTDPSLYDRSVEMQVPGLSGTPPQTEARQAQTKSKLTTEQKLTVVVAICAFIVLIPNVQQLLNQQLPVLSSNATLQVLVNAAFIAALYHVMKDQMMTLL